MLIRDDKLYLCLILICFFVFSFATSATAATTVPVACIQSDAGCSTTDGGIELRQGKVARDLALRIQACNGAASNQPGCDSATLQGLNRQFQQAIILDGTPAAVVAQQNKIAAAATDDSACSFWNFAFGRCIWYPLMGYIGTFFLFVGGSVLQLAGSIFNLLIGYFVVEFGKTIQSLQLIDGIHSAWTVLRDLSNIVIIGMFTFIAISIIIGNHTFGEKKLVAKVLVVAVLINFSLLFAKVIIDASNFVAFQVYKSMSDSNGSGNANIAGRFIAVTSVSKVFKATSESLAGGTVATTNSANSGGTASADANTAAAKKASGGFFHGLVGGLMLLFAAGVLLYGCYLIVARAVLLIFLMLVSALAFATYLIPNLSGGEYGWSAWWKSLINAAVFGPLLMILLYVSLVVITKMPSGGGQTDADGWLPILSFAVGIGMLYVSFKVANSFAGKIAGFSMARGIVDKTLGFAVGAGGLAGRQTVGWSATKFSQSRAGRALATAPIIGRPMRSMLYGAAAGTYDLRNALGMKSALKTAGISLGDAAKEGYLKSLKTRQKHIKETEEERVGFFTAKSRKEKKIEAAHEDAQSESQKIKSGLEEAQKARDAATKIRTDAANKVDEHKVEASEILKRGAEQAGEAPPPAFTEGQALTETRDRIEEGRRVAIARGDAASADRLRIISERLGELGKTIEKADKTISDMDTTVEENTKKQAALKPALEQSEKALKEQKKEQEKTRQAFKDSISREFYAGLFGDRLLSSEVAKDVIKSVQKTPHEKEAEKALHVLTHLMEHGDHGHAKDQPAAGAHGGGGGADHGGGGTGSGHGGGGTGHGATGGHGVGGVKR